MSKYPTTALTDVAPDELTWLTGSWVGARGQDQVEEHWSALAGGSLMGMFRWIQQDRVRFYEFTTIAREGVELIFRIKHFNPGLVGWEEKDESKEFVLVQLDHQAAVFLQRKVTDRAASWMIYRLENVQRLVSYFESEGEAVADQDKFIYTRSETNRT